MAASTDTMTTAPPPAPAVPTRTSRAVIRLIDAGNSAYCAHCGDAIKFRARIRAYQIICNVYVDGRWDRVEHFHEECYDEAAAPHGEAQQ